MATNQESIIAAIVTKLSLSGRLTYNEAIMELCKNYGISDTDFNSMYAQYLSIASGSSQDNINGLLAAYSSLFFDNNVNSINDIIPQQPQSISDLQLMLNPQDNSTIIDDTTENEVEQINDLTSNAYDFSQETATAQGTLQSNGTIEFDGSDYYLNEDAGLVSTYAIGQDKSVFLVVSIADITGGAAVITQNRETGTNDTFGIGINASNDLVVEYQSVSLAQDWNMTIALSGNVSNDELFVISTTWDATEKTNISYLNNSLLSSGGGLSNSGVSGVGKVSYGAKPDGVSPIIGNMADLIVFGRTLSETERQYVVNYLANKHNITL